MSDVPRGLQNKGSAIQSVVLTADVFQFFIKRFIPLSDWSRQLHAVLDLPGYNFTIPFEIVGVTNDI